MIVVSNASPLVGLASIRQLDLLRQLYSEAHIPGAVWQEVVVDGVDAKRKGLIDEVKRYLDELRNVFGFRVSENLYQRVLTDEGEWP
jgi:predicted nucleic acid-binding protein